MHAGFLFYGIRKSERNKGKVPRTSTYFFPYLRIVGFFPEVGNHVIPQYIVIWDIILIGSQVLLVIVECAAFHEVGSEDQVKIWNASPATLCKSGFGGHGIAFPKPLGRCSKCESCQH